MKYERILLKLSGEALAGHKGTGYCAETLEYFAGEIAQVAKKGIQTGIVIGGGNIFRGLPGATKGIRRATGDHMGMLATVMNSIALQDALIQKGLQSRVLTAFEAGALTETTDFELANRYLSQGYVVIFGGGTGNPFFTTDSAAALRAAEINAAILIKGTRVDGVYSADPEKDPHATRYEHLTFEEAYNKGLKIMDLTAFTICRENNMEVLVIDINRKGNLFKAVSGEKTGTLITNR